MNPKRAIKLIKRHERIPQQRVEKVKIAVGPNMWSTAVRAWVVEFQTRDHSESLPAFDSQFKDALLQPEGAD